VKLACGSLVLLALAACASDPPPQVAPTVTLPVATAFTAPVPPASSAPVASDPPLDLPGVDTRALSPREHAQWATLVRQLVAPCPSVAVPLAQCVQEGRDCRSCAPAARWVAHAVRSVASDESIRTAYAARFDPSRVTSLPLDGSPVKGPADAPVTVVEFVDMECPACRAAQPAVDATLAAHAGKVRLVLKMYPIPMHPHAEAAARAAFAAERQGKLWEMEHAMLDGQQHLEPRDIEGYARKLGLDVARFRADLSSPDVAAKMARDKQLVDALSLAFTPAFYVNGRMLGDDDVLEDRVREELEGL
jgi:protein-disulfide isomerase